MDDKNFPVPRPGDDMRFVALMSAILAEAAGEWLTPWQERMRETLMQEAAELTLDRLRDLIDQVIGAR